MSRVNYSERLHQSLKEGGFDTTTWAGGRPRAFTFVRKSGVRRIKLWLWGHRLRTAPQADQLKVEAALKKNYGEAYLGGYFIRERCGYTSFCIVLDQSKL